MKKITYILVAISVVTLVSCNDFLNVNTNPNQLTVVKPDFILSGALVQTGNIKSGGDVNAYAGMWAGYFSASGSYSQSGDVVRTYILTQTYGNTVWADFYANLSNYQYVENNVGKQTQYANYVAICEIMKAYNFQNLVDIFGDIPYSQALTGFQFLYPKYDPAATIYQKLSDRLDSAVTLIKNAPVTALVPPTTTDVMFSGNMTRWAQLANTLKLRLLLHQSEVAGNTAYITGEISKITANGYGYLGVGQDALINPGYSAAAGLQAPFWENYGLSFSGQIGGRDYDRASDFAVTFFKSFNDPRIAYFFRAPGDTPGKNLQNLPYVGIPFGAPPTTSLNSGNTSGFGPGILSGPTQPTIFISAAQSLFLQAEAAERGWISGTAQTFYESGISESFRILGASGATAFYSGSNIVDVDYSASPNKLEAIITQKWAANYGVDAIEAWVDSRRLSLPNGIPISQDPTKIASQNPRRLLYPQSEYNNNTRNVNGEGTISIFTSKIFWDAQ